MWRAHKHGSSRHLSYFLPAWAQSQRKRSHFSTDARLCFQLTLPPGHAWPTGKRGFSARHQHMHLCTQALNASRWERPRLRGSGLAFTRPRSRYQESVSKMEVSISRAPDMAMLFSISTVGIFVLKPDSDFCLKFTITHLLVMLHRDISTAIYGTHRLPHDSNKVVV